LSVQPAALAGHVEDTPARENVKADVFRPSANVPGGTRTIPLIVTELPKTALVPDRMKVGVCKYESVAVP